MAQIRIPRDPSQDGGWGWVVVCGSFLNHFLFEGMIRSYGLLYQVLQTRYQGSAAVTAWIQATFNAVAMATGPLISVCMERVSCRVVVISGGVLLCTSLILSAYTPDMYFLFFSYSFIGGCGGGLIYSPMIVILSEYFEHKRGKAMGLAALGGAVGTTALPPLVGYLLDNYGYSGCLVILAGIVLHNCISGVLYRPLRREAAVTLEASYICSQSIFGSRELYDRHSLSNFQDKLEHENVTERIPAKPSVPTKTGSGQNLNYLQVPKPEIKYVSSKGSKFNENHKEHQSIRIDAQINAAMQADKSSKSKPKLESCAKKCDMFSMNNDKRNVLKNVSFLLFCLNLFNIPTTLISTFIFLPGLGSEVGLSDTRCALLVSIIGAASAFGRLSFGFIFDLPFVKRHRRLFHSILGVCLGLSTASMAICNNFVSMSVVAVGIGISEGGVMAQRATALSQYVNPNQLAFAFGILTMFQGFGNLTGPLFQGFLRDRVGTYTVCFYYGGGVTLLSSFFLIIDYFLRFKNHVPITDSDIEINQSS